MSRSGAQSESGPTAAPTPLPPGPILVIKLGALGDMVQATGPFRAIRDHHSDRHIVLLTTPPFERFAIASGFFDEVWTDTRPAGLDVKGWLALRLRLRGPGFARVYDLQTSERSSLYFRLFWPGPYPQWSGIARGCSHPHANPARDRLHTLARQAEQLQAAGISSVPPPDVSWALADAARFGLPGAYALLVPGGAVHRPRKRWPAARFAALARRLASRGVAPVVIGTSVEAAIVAEVAAAAPEILDLSDQTSFLDIVALARHATLAVGNDTGPMHLITAAGCPSVVLFSDVSDPALCAPAGPAVRIVRRADLKVLSVDEVWGTLRPALP